MRLFRLAMVVLLVGSCGSPSPGLESPAPTRSSVRLMDYQTVDYLTEASAGSAIFSATPAEVWAALPAAYDALGIPVTESSPGRLFRPRWTPGPGPG